MNYDIHDPEGQKIKLFTPGPVQVPDWALAELAKPNDTHRSNPYSDLHGMVKKKLQMLLHTKNEIFLWTNSGSGVMEACTRNLLGPNDKGLFLSCGAFGNRWAQMAELNGKNFKKVEIEWGKGFTPEKVKEELEKDKFSTVFITMNETSTGVMNPIWDISPVVKKYGALLCVDAVSCMGGVKIDVDKWGVDVMLAAVQKCFALPSGLSVSTISDAALEKAKSVPNKGWYFNFEVIKTKSKKNQTPSTPSIPHIRALNVTLDKIFEEGPENRYKRHENLSKIIQDWAIKQGFGLFADEGFRSHTVTTINNTRNINVAEFVKKSIQQGYRFVNGYGSKLKEKTFRIAAMGWRQPEDVEEFLKVLSKILEDK
ncbi:MAG: pyridoxal-phosphate-dependent aminotransferase family protein [Promethearchaeota archaeon]